MRSSVRRVSILQKVNEYFKKTICTCRLAILKKGTIRKKATIGKLKKEINGYIVTFNLKHKTYDEVDSASSPATNDASDSLAEKLITEIANFGQGKLRDNHHVSFPYHYIR